MTTMSTCRSRKREKFEATRSTLLRKQITKYFGALVEGEGRSDTAKLDYNVLAFTDTHTSESQLLRRRRAKMLRFHVQRYHESATLAILEGHGLLGRGDGDFNRLLLVVTKTGRVALQSIRKRIGGRGEARAGHRACG